MSEKIGILGAGGQANETLSYDKERELAFMAVNTEYITQEHHIDVDNPDKNQVEVPVIAAVGAPALRRKMVENWEGDKYTSVISDQAYLDSSLEIGVGCLVGPRAVITTDVNIGDHVLVNVAATISHNCIIEDYVTISPGAHLGGNVTVGRGAFIGIGAVISNDIKIAEGVVVGAGAVLISDADVVNGVYVGVPAKLIKINEGWLDAI